ncbi:hypothetical protein BGX38DRAFT_351104 [Terfezia claveryi]|nr:hypothetical protein BGX38DRAFT_351104 [Terfezia claveryi]
MGHFLDASVFVAGLGYMWEKLLGQWRIFFLLCIVSSLLGKEATPSYQDNMNVNTTMINISLPYQNTFHVLCVVSWQ